MNFLCFDPSKSTERSTRKLSEDWLRPLAGFLWRVLISNSIRFNIKCVLAAILTIGCVTPASAQDSLISSYSTEQGLASVDVFAVQAVPANANKSTDKYRLWVGTSRGLREYFDSAFHEPQITHGADAVIVTNAVISATINALLATDGTLWIGADTGLHRRNADGSWEINLEEQAGLDTVEITALCASSDGSVWAGSHQGLIRWDGHAWTRLTLGDLPLEVVALAEDAQHDLWVASGVSRASRIYILKGADLVKTIDGDRFLPEGAVIRDLLKDGYGIMWAATDGGLLEFAGYAVKRVYTRKMGLSSNEVFAVAENHAGGVWIGTGLGLDYLANGKVYNYLTSMNGLAGNAVYTVAYDVEGNLWIGTNSGVTRVALPWSKEPNPLLRSAAIRQILLFPDGEAYVASTNGVLQRTLAGGWRRLSKGLISPNVFALARDEDGELWVGTDAGIYKLANEQFITGPSELELRYTTSILFDSPRSKWVGTNYGLFHVTGSQDDGYHVETVRELEQIAVLALWETTDSEIWVGTKNKGAFRLADGKWVQFLHVDSGLADDIIHTGIQDSAGNIWFGTARGLSRMHSGAKADSQNTWTSFQVPDLASEIVYALAEDTRQPGSIWVATEGGLNLIQGDAVSTFTQEDGLSNKWIWSLSQDQEGKLWIGTDAGLTYHLDAQVPPSLHLDAPLIGGKTLCDIDCQQQGVPYNSGWAEVLYRGSDLGDLHGLRYRVSVERSAATGRPMTPQISVTTDTSYRQDLAPGTTYTISVEAIDKHFKSSAGTTPPIVLRVQEPTILERVRDNRVSLPVTVMVLVSIVAYSSSLRVRRLLQVQTGFRWHFATEQCDYVVKITQDQQVIKLATEVPDASPRIQGTSIPLNAAWPPAQIEPLRSTFQKGSTVRVVAEDRLFSWPWSHELGSGWSAGAHSIIAGQQLFTMVVSGQRETYSSRNIACAALRCANAVGQPPLANPKYEIEEIVRCFRKWNAAVFTLERDAMVGDLQHALADSDIVHVSAHATAEGIFLADRFMTVNDLGPDLLRTMRCRLLVLSACEAGKWNTDHGFVLRLVQSGVNVIAAVRVVGDVWSFYFFRDFYRAFLPSEKKQREGSIFAEAVRATSSKLAKRASEQANGVGGKEGRPSWQSTVDSFILYGDPSLKLSFQWKRRDEMSTDLKKYQRLSKLSSRQMNWETLTDTIRLTSAGLGRTRGMENEAAAAILPVDPSAIENAFRVYKDEFVKASTWSRRAINIAIAILILSLAIAVVGALLFSTTAWGGGILAVAGIGGLLGMVAQVRLLSRDQLMLEMIPAKYELALRLASSREQYQTILDAMLAETHSLRN